MGRGALALGVLLAGTTPALAQTGAHFTLGLGAEYLSTVQTGDGSRWRESTLQPTASLDFDGSVLDPRFVLFHGQLLTTGFRLEQSGEQATTRRQVDYGLGVRAFSNRAVSVELTARRSDSTVTGPTVAGLAAGVDETVRAVVDVRPKGWPQFRLSQTMQRFTADDPATLRDLKNDVTELTGAYTRGLIAGDLLLRREKNDIYNGLIRQDLDIGNASLEVNRGGRDSFLTRLYLSRYRSETGADEETPATTSLVLRNRFRHLIGERGSADVYFNHQSARYDGGAPLGFEQPGASLVLPVSRYVQTEAEASYLASDLDGNRSLRQPVASLGVRFGRDFDGWSVALNPRANYVAASGSGVASESSWGGQVYGAIRANFARIGAGLEGEYDGNQLSIAAQDPNLPVGGQSTLAGLDKDRRFLRFALRVEPLRRLVVSGTAEVNRALRVSVFGDVAEEVRRAQIDVSAGPLRLSGTASRVDVTGGEIPSSTRIESANLYVTPASWLLLDALVQNEKRVASASMGEFRYGEAGVRLRYAKLSLYARIRQEESGGDGTVKRRDRRVWAGVGRTFDFAVGQTRGLGR